MSVTRLPVVHKQSRTRRAGKSGPPQVDVPSNLRSLDDLRLEMGVRALAAKRAELLLEWAVPVVSVCRDIDCVPTEDALLFANATIKRAEEFRDSLMMLAQVRNDRRKAREAVAG